MLGFLLPMVATAVVSFVVAYVVACWSMGVPPWPIRWFDRG